MKCRISILAAAIACLVWPAMAVTWQKQSAAFTFPGAVGAANELAARMGASFGWNWANGNQNICFSFRLPESVHNATIGIYSLSGILIERFDVRREADVVAWDVSSKRIGTGVYLARLEFGKIKREIRLAIVK
jgi:hypothetical protein